MTNADTLISRRDLDFLLFDWLQVERLFSLPRFEAHDRQTVEQVLDLFADLAIEHFAPHNRRNDEHEPRLAENVVTLNPEVGTAIRAFADAGLMSAVQVSERGGMGLPTVVDQAGMAYLFAANPGSAGYPFLAKANANLLLAHGGEDLIRRYAMPVLDGRALGTMCLSEPQAGSSLADIRTRAVPMQDGRYRLHGNKMWISAGDHELTGNIIHAVLAKVPDENGKLPAGVAGISLFAVPKYLVDNDGNATTRNDVVVAGLNHKMGNRGTVNCALNFGEGSHLPEGEPGAIGEIIGEPGQGLAQMFHMMNEARIGVGLGAAATAYVGYRHALAYALDRTQGRPRSQRDPSSSPVAIVEHADVRRMLLAAKCYAEGALALCLWASRLSDVIAAGAVEQQPLLDLMTPIVKSWPSQWGLAANDLAIQVHGGYGYTRDYPVEQFYRDNRLNAIHEGTHGIQALDLLGRKVGMAHGEGFAMLERRIRATIADAREQPFTSEAASLETAFARLRAVTASLARETNAERRLANASAYLEAFGHVVVAWQWLDQALTASRLHSGSDLAAGKVQACRFFYAWELPRVDAWFAVLDPIDTSVLSMRPEWF